MRGGSTGLDWRPVAFPVFLAWAILFSDYAGIAAPFGYLGRPLLVLLVGGLIIGMAAALMWRGRPMPALATGSLLVAGVMRPSLVSWLLLPIAIWVAGRLVQRTPGFARGWLPRATRGTSAASGVTGFAAILCVVALARAVLVSDIGPSQAPARGGQTVAAPDAYLILVDGYPNADSLERIHGISIAEFLEALQDRGFDVYPNSWSDHSWTQLAVAALLRGDLTGIPDGVSGVDEQRAGLRLLDAAEPQVSRFREAGYEFVVTSAGAGHTTISGVDRDLSSDALTDLEGHLLASSIAPVAARDPTIAALIGALHERLNHDLAVLADVADDPGPQLALVHLLAPHPPFRYGSDGQELDDLDCWPDCLIFNERPSHLGLDVEAYRLRLQWQIEAVNDRLLAAIGELITRDPDAVVVLFSDHGLRHEAGHDERRRTFLAALTPGHPNLYGDEPHVVDLLRGLGDAYLSGGP